MLNSKITGVSRLLQKIDLVNLATLFISTFWNASLFCHILFCSIVVLEGKCSSNASGVSDALDTARMVSLL